MLNLSSREANGTGTRQRANLVVEVEGDFRARLECASVARGYCNRRRRLIVIAADVYAHGRGRVLWHHQASPWSEASFVGR